jgi:hypothetical protein
MLADVTWAGAVALGQIIRTQRTEKGMTLTEMSNALSGALRLARPGSNEVTKHTVRSLEVPTIGTRPNFWLIFAAMTILYLRDENGTPYTMWEALLMAAERPLPPSRGIAFSLPPEAVVELIDEIAQQKKNGQLTAYEDIIMTRYQTLNWGEGEPDIDLNVSREGVFDLNAFENMANFLGYSGLGLYLTLLNRARMKRMQ